MWGRLVGHLISRAQSSNPEYYNQSIVKAMPKYNPNSRFSDCWASVGNITFYHRNGQCYFRKKSVCKFSRTAGQIAVSEIHLRALAAWRALDHDVQLRWNEYAKAVPSHRPPFDGTTHITGHNLFVSAYHGFAQIGNEHIPEPRRWTQFPGIVIESISAVLGKDNLRLLCKTMVTKTSEPSRYRLYIKIQLASVRDGKNSGKMRTFLAEENFKHSESVVEVPVSFGVWNADLNEYRVFCRYSLIDTITGYRNNFKEGVFAVKVNSNSNVLKIEI